MTKEKLKYKELTKEHHELRENAEKAHTNIIGKTKSAREHIKTLKKQTLGREIKTETFKLLEQTQDDIDQEMKV